MLLQEEYLLRHKLDFPIIPHVKKGAILFENGMQPCSLLKIQWTPCSYRPGKYIFNFYHPVHDFKFKSGSVPEIFEPKTEEKVLQYEDYTDFICDLIKCWDIDNVLMESREIDLAMWHIFIFCFDSWCSRQKSLEKLIYKSIDPDLGIDERHMNYEIALLELKLIHPMVYDFFMEKIFDEVQPYSYWLAKQIKKSVEKKLFLS